MAGVPGFEPGNAGIKNRCLTAWRYPNNRAVNRLLEEDGWGTWIRTRECRYQKPVPYRLAIPHPCNAYPGMVREARLELAHLAAPEPKSGASTNFATPAKKDGGYDGIRTCDPIIMSDVL